MRSVRRLPSPWTVPSLLGLWLAWPAWVWAQSIIATLPVAGSQMAVNSVTHQVYVANSSGTVTVIDGYTDSTTTLEVGGSPSAVAVNEMTNQIYVANAPSNSVTVIDGATNALTTVTDPNAAGPVLLAVNATTNKIYVVNWGSLNVTVIDGASNSTTTVAGPIQSRGFDNAAALAGMAINAVTNQIYVATSHSHLILDGEHAGQDVCDDGSNVTVIDGASSAVTNVSVGPCPQGIAVNPVTNTVFVALGGSVAVIDGATNAVTTVAVGGASFAVNSATNKIYVTSGGNVTVIDGATLSTTTLAVASPGAMAVDAATNTVYVTNGVSGNCPGTSCNPGSVTVIDGATNATTTLADPHANGPDAIAIDASADRIYVANGGSGNLTVISGDDAVPNVVGATQSAASSAITGAGLIVGTVTQQSSSTVPAGSVISENPASGSYVRPGFAVNLVVSSGSPGGGGGGAFDLLTLGALLGFLSLGLRDRCTRSPPRLRRFKHDTER